MAVSHLCQNYHFSSTVVVHKLWHQTSGQESHIHHKRIIILTDILSISPTSFILAFFSKYRLHYTLLQQKYNLHTPCYALLTQKPSLIPNFCFTSPPTNEITLSLIVTKSFCLQQGWCSVESTRLTSMWFGFNSLTRHHTWVKFVGSLLCSERFFPAYSGFLLSPKTNIF